MDLLYSHLMKEISFSGGALVRSNKKEPSLFVHSLFPFSLDFFSDAKDRYST